MTIRLATKLFPVKALIIGSSLTGKTTLIRYLRKKYELEVYEIDEELNRLNGGTFPRDKEYKNTVLVPQIKDKVLSSDAIIFFTNTHYFTLEDIELARKKGYKIIQFIVDKSLLEKRNKHRMVAEGYDDHSKWFDSMLSYQKEIKEKLLVDKVIETDKPTEQIANELLTFLENVDKE